MVVISSYLHDFSCEISCHPHLLAAPNCFFLLLILSNCVPWYFFFLVSHFGICWVFWIYEFLGSTFCQESGALLPFSSLNIVFPLLGTPITHMLRCLKFSHILLMLFSSLQHYLIFLLVIHSGWFLSCLTFTKLFFCSTWSAAHPSNLFCISDTVIPSLEAWLQPSLVSFMPLLNVLSIWSNFNADFTSYLPFLIFVSVLHCFNWFLSPNFPAFLCFWESSNAEHCECYLIEVLWISVLL